MRGVLSGLSQPRWGTQEGVFRGESGQRHSYCPDWRWALSGWSRTCRCITKVSKDWPGSVDRDHPPEEPGASLWSGTGTEGCVPLSPRHRAQGGPSCLCRSGACRKGRPAGATEDIEIMFGSRGGEGREGPEAACPLAFTFV